MSRFFKLYRAHSFHLVQFVKNEFLLFSRRSRSRAVTAKKCTKKRVMQSCCFASPNLLLFDVLVAVAVVVTQVTQAPLLFTGK